MASKLLQIVLTQLLVTKALSSLLQPYSARQYGPASRPGIPKVASTYPSSPYSSNYKTFYTQNYPQQYYPSYPKAPEIPTQFPTPQIQQVVKQIPQIEQKTICESKLETSPMKASGKIDSHVLNNLAIALQLLIVNNIINNPSEGHEHIPAISDSILELVLPNKLGAVQMPNSKFLGTSTFGQDIAPPIFGTYGIASGLPAPRPGVNLMSPYDAIAKSLPVSESIVSSFMAKNDFISPYASIAGDNDLFSMTDLFM